MFSEADYWQVLIITAPHYSRVVVFELGAPREAHQHNWDMFSSDNLRTALS